MIDGDDGDVCDVPGACGGFFRLSVGDEKTLLVGLAWVSDESPDHGHYLASSPGHCHISLEELFASDESLQTWEQLLSPTGRLTPVGWGYSV